MRGRSDLDYLGTAARGNFGAVTWRTLGRLASLAPPARPFTYRRSPYSASSASPNLDPPFAPARRRPTISKRRINARVCKSLSPISTRRVNALESSILVPGGGVSR